MSTHLLPTRLHIAQRILMKLETYRLGKNRQFDLEEQALMVRRTKYTVAEVTRAKKRDPIPIELGFAATLLGGTVSECPFTSEVPTMPSIFGREKGFMYRNNTSEMGDHTGPTTDCTECGFESDSVDIGPVELRYIPHPAGRKTIITPAQKSAPFPSEDIGWERGRFIEDDLSGRLILAFGTLLRPVITEELL